MADYSRPLSKYLKAGLKVRCECRKCGHVAIFDPRGLARIYGPTMDPAYIPFRCHAPRALDGRRCLCRNIHVAPDWPYNPAQQTAKPPAGDAKMLD